MLAAHQIPQIIAAQVRQARIAARMTQQELAARAGVSISTVRALEQGFANPSLSSLIALSEALGLTKGWDTLFAIPSDPFEEYDQRVAEKDTGKARVRKK
jgi:transcriptional regulator with XRE-family HTH domain